VSPDFWYGWTLGIPTGLVLGYVFDRFVLRPVVDWYVGVWRRRAW
jgi:hypothetical protein